MLPIQTDIPKARGAWPVIQHAIAFRRDPIGFFRKQAREMGPVYYFQLFQRKIIVANDPEAVQTILIGEVQHFSRKKTYVFLKALLGEGLITSEGDHWRKNRRMLQPGFKREQLAGLMEGVQSTVVDWCQTLGAGDRNARSVDLHQAMNALTLKVLTRSIIETGWSGELEAFQGHLATAWNHLTDQRFQSTEPGGQKSGLAFWNRAKIHRTSEGKKAIGRLKEIIAEIIIKRRASHHEANDLLAMLLSAKDPDSDMGLSDAEILDEVMTIVIAGHDTTASALTWTFHCLAQHPGWAEQIRAEAQSLPRGAWSTTDVAQLQVTKRVIQEAMRLFPPVWTFGRKTTASLELCGFQIPADCSVTMPLVGVHRHADHWERPDHFHPNHFLPESMQQRHKMAYFPFGAGQRMCIGSHYAMMEMQTIVARILRTFSVVMPPVRKLRILPQVTLQPGQPMPCVFEPLEQS
nr:cytochrome P450 family protein [uncultured bacterium]